MVDFLIASALDAADVAEIHMRSWEAAYDQIIPAGFITEKNATRSEMWKKTLSGKNDKHYVINLEGKTVGIMTVASPQDGELGNEIYELHGLYLHPNHYRQGIGTQAMDFAISLARSLGKTAMVLNVLEENTAACRFYEKCGFQFDGTKTEVNYGKPLMVIRYRREI